MDRKWRRKTHWGEEMVNTAHGTVVTEQAKRSDRRDYRVLLWLAVTCFFFVSVVTRVLPRGLRPFGRTDGVRESCLEEARRMANAVIPYAFEW